MYEHKIIRVTTDTKAEKTLSEHREMGYTLEGWKTYLHETVQWHIFVFERFTVPDTTVKEAVAEYLSKAEVGG
jgi:hypothetical protein